MVTMYKTKLLTAPHQAGSPHVSPPEFLSSSHNLTISSPSLSTPPSPRPTGTVPLSQPAEAARGQRPLPTLTEASKGSHAAYCNSLLTGLLASLLPVCRRAARASRVTPPLRVSKVPSARSDALTTIQQGLTWAASLLRLQLSHPHPLYPGLTGHWMLPEQDACPPPALLLSPGQKLPLW